MLKVYVQQISHHSIIIIIIILFKHTHKCKMLFERYHDEREI